MRAYIVILVLAIYLAIAQACASCGGGGRGYNAVYHQQGCTTCRARNRYDPSRYYERSDAMCNSCSGGKKKKNRVKRCKVCRDMTKLHNEHNRGGVCDVRAHWSQNSDTGTSMAKCPSGFQVVACRGEGPTNAACLILGTDKCVARGPVVQAYAVCKRAKRKICGTWSAKCPSQYKMTSCIITLFGNLVAPERRVENLGANTCSTIVPINHAVTTITCELSLGPTDVVVDAAAAPPEETTTADPAATTDPNATTAVTVAAPTTENPFKEYYDYLWALYKWYTGQVSGRGSGSGHRGGVSCAPRQRRRVACGYGGYGGGSHYGGYGGYGQRASCYH